MQHEKILILDFGSQYTQLIARRVRESNVYCEILPWDIDEDKIKSMSPKGIILSGGPATVTEKKFPKIPIEIFSKGIPILGICYGLQLITKIFGGKVKTLKKTNSKDRNFRLFIAYYINKIRLIDNV